MRSCVAIEVRAPHSTVAELFADPLNSPRWMNELDREELAELRETFDLNDRNGDGVLDFDEFAALMLELDPAMVRHEARIGFDEVDADRDGAIGFDEFVGWWTER